MTRGAGYDWQRIYNLDNRWSSDCDRTIFSPDSDSSSRRLLSLQGLSGGGGGGLRGELILPSVPAAAEDSFVAGRVVAAAVYAEPGPTGSLLDGWDLLLQR